MHASAFDTSFISFEHNFNTWKVETGGSLSLRLFLAGKIVLDQPGQFKTIFQKTTKTEKKTFQFFYFMHLLHK